MVLEPDEAVVGERLDELVGGGLAILGRTVEKFAEVDEGKLEGRKGAHCCSLLAKKRTRKR